MEKKIEEHGLSILSLFIILVLMMGDCYFRFRELGSMYIPLFLIIPVLCTIFEHILEETMTKEQWMVWFWGSIVVGILVALIECFLRYSLLMGIKLGAALSLSVLVTVWLSQIKLFSENKKIITVERMGKTVEYVLFLCCILAPRSYEGLLLNAYFCFICVYAGYIYLKYIRWYERGHL